MPISRIETASLDSALVAPTATALTTASGSAPSYSARAWVNFNGTGTVAIRASGNVSSITDNGTGDYTVNFTTAMSDANFNTVGLIGRNPDGSGGNRTTTCYIDRYSTSTSRVVAQDFAGTLTDIPSVFVAIFR